MSIRVRFNNHPLGYVVCKADPIDINHEPISGFFLDSRDDFWVIHDGAWFFLDGFAYWMFGDCYQDDKTAKIHWQKANQLWDSVRHQQLRSIIDAPDIILEHFRTSKALEDFENGVEEIPA